MGGLVRFICCETGDAPAVLSHGQCRRRQLLARHLSRKIICSLQGLFSSDIEHDGNGHHDYDDASENKQELAPRPVGADISPLDVSLVCHSLGHLKVSESGENEARDGPCDSSREV